jgi:arylsulfatase A-like enzyme
VHLVSAPTTVLPWLIASLILLGALGFRFSAHAADRPNVLIILSDDQGWGDLSVSGNTNIATPAIDSLAKDGALFDRFYVCPVCAPTRAEMLTGRYHLRSGVRGVTSGGERMNLGETTVAELFKSAGYATGAFGKWHNGMQYPYHPCGRGFDEFYGFCSGHWGDYFDAPVEHNGQLTKSKEFLADDLTDRAMAFIEQHKSGPFFCYLPLNTPHSPMQVPDRFFAKFEKADLKMRARDPKAEDLDFTRAALAMCENIDWNVDRLLKKLTELKLAENTIVIYFSDNGPNSWRWNGGMKGRKGSTDEGGVRSPFMIRWTGHIPAGTRIPQIAGAIDLLPTLAELAGVPLKTEKPLDGVSLKPLLTGTAKDWPERTLFSYWAGKTSARTQKYRLDQTGNLYDMEADPEQEKNIAKEQPEVTARLAKAVVDWKKDVRAEGGKDDRPYTVGYPAFPVTQLPARDGLPHGNIKRSSRHPNCSFFTNWTSPDDRMTWNIDVKTAGRYEVEIHYTCPAADIGSTIELSLGEDRLQGTVSEAYDPPLRGAEHDRVKRDESYVKDFKPLKLGTLELKVGLGELTLRALKVPGKQVMDVRLLLLTLKD